MSGRGSEPAPRAGPLVPASRYGRYVGVLAIALLLLIGVNTLLTTPVSSHGVAPGTRLPPFAVPLASGSLVGDADVATRPDQGAAGRRPACSLRGPQIVNVCALYERGPVLLALFTDGGGCPAVLDTIASVLPGFPGLRAIAVSIKGSRANLRRLVAAHRWPFPVGYDRDGVLASLYGVVVCPQLTFAYPGGIAQGYTLQRPPTAEQLRARLTQLIAESRARGWRPGGRR